MKCKSNGFLIVGPAKTFNDICYFGVNTDVWPAGELLFSESTQKKLNESSMDYEKVFLLNLENAVEYYEHCCSIGIPSRLIYCESATEGTFYEAASISAGLENAHFLGYDYAFSSGEYYSAIANDVLYRHLDISSKWRPLLNKYGLFSSYETVCSFAKDRERISFLANHGNPYPVYEPGEFSIFRIFEVVQDGGRLETTE